jgi:Trk K+ transport system NAD-binding subunit
LRHRGNALSEAESNAPLDSIFAPVYDDTRLDVVLDILTSTPQTWATVIDKERSVLGTISLSDIVRNYQRTARTYLRRLSEVSGRTGVVDVLVESDSPVSGLALRSSLFPRGVLITAIERGYDVIRPSGDTVLQPGDRLTVLGSAVDINRLEHLSGSTVFRKKI